MSRVLDQYKRASRSLAGGVSSSTRVNQALGHPLYIDRADGYQVWDLDGKPYIDLCCSHGATLLGHGHRRVRRAVEGALARGAACSYESELHGELAALLCDTVPCLERLRFTGSGTEATMHCIRLARAITGRTKLLRFEGNFHGYHDQVMFGADELGQFAPPLTAQSTGVTPGLQEHLIQIPYNDVAMLNRAFDRHGDELAAAICEPVYYNAGCILPDPEFINTLRKRTANCGALLIFDEVLSAFRMCAGGAQQHLGITPDLCTLGKSVGGGYPISVFGGRAELMERLMPQGDCQHSGTYNAHPVPVAAALAAVQTYCEVGFYDHLNEIGDRLLAGINAAFQRHGVQGLARGLGARFGIYFGVTGPIRNYQQAQQHDRRQMLKFIAAAIGEGVYFHDYGGAACHHGFCAAMTLEAVDEAVGKLDQAIGQLATG